MKLLTPHRHRGLLIFATAGVASCALAGFASQAPAMLPEPTPDQATFFETKIRPVLAKECFACHGATTQMADVRLDTAAGAAKAVVAGDPEKSPLIRAVRYSGAIKMPPSHRLKAEEIADLQTWVKMGAPWPKANAAVRKQDLPLWSLAPVVKPAVPKPKNAAWVLNPIDAFVLARQTAKGVPHAATADRRTLLRRVTYDLTGLPPTVDETNAFLGDKRPGAYERVVDRLLASPRYGERWARQWLDVARYADTKGYVFNEDRNYPNAYTYRAWVIKALNDDLPYDRFLMDQIAADRLPETQGDDKEALAALGFLTLGRRFLNDGQLIIDDRIDVTMRGMQGFTVACARCHDHKFDPIPTQDYYSLYGIFESSDERAAPISPKAISAPWESFNAKVGGLERDIRDLVLAQTKILRANPQGDVKNVLQGLGDGAQANDDQLRTLAPAFEPAARDRLAALRKDLDETRRTAPPTPELAMAMVDRGDAHDGVVFKRGNAGNRGEVAPRRFLLALSKKAERKNWTQGSGRLELAQSIASKDNPLTARVFVNRVWMGHFGTGIVRTPSDFGHQGDKPTDPALLDYLASTFMESGWSIKRLHRLIVTSSTYRQSSDATPAVIAADPENRLLTRMNRSRLDLEEMRDSLMAAAGRLDLKTVGGRSVDLWSRPFNPRRAVYGYVERQNLPGIFRTFDFASPDSTSPRRFFTTVPQQALFFLNSALAVDTARAVAERAEVQGAADDAQRLRRLYLLLFGRLPDADETAVGLAYLAKGGVAPPSRSPWRYGYGNVANGRVGFTPLMSFVDGTYRFAPTIPVPGAGYLSLNAGGGHPGPDHAHAAIRRWVAPAAMTISVGGALVHPNANGDGVHGLVVSSRTGLLGEWTAHNGSVSTDVKSVTVQKGETIDFVLDPGANDGFDSFSWSPTVRSDKGTWEAASGFGPPAPAAPSRLALYAQALLMTDEFLFVD